MTRPGARSCRTTTRPFRLRNPEMNAALAATGWLRHLGERAGDFALDVYAELCRVGGPAVEFDPSTGSAQLPDGERLEFARLAARAARHRPAEWPALIRQHIRSAAVDAPAEFERLLDDGDAARLRLRRRLLVPSAWGADDTLVSQALTSDLHAAVVLELDAGCAAVFACHLDRWELSDDEAWRLAGDNDARIAPRVADDGVWPLDDGVWVLDGDGLVTGAALRLDESLPVEAPGALVAAPNSHQLLVAQLPPLDSAAPGSLVRLVAEVGTFAASLMDGHTAPLGRDILWYRPGEADPLVGVFDAATESLVAPDPLRSALVA